MQFGFSGHGEPAEARWSSSVCVCDSSFWIVSGASFLHSSALVSQRAVGKPRVFMRSGRGAMSFFAAPARIWPAPRAGNDVAPVAKRRTFAVEGAAPGAPATEGTGGTDGDGTGPIPTPAHAVARARAPVAPATSDVRRALRMEVLTNGRRCRTGRR